MRKFVLVTGVAACFMAAPALAAHEPLGASGKSHGSMIGSAITQADLSELQTLGGRDAILRASPDLKIIVATKGHGSHHFRHFLHDFLEELIEKICERSGGQIVTPSSPGGLPGCVHKKKKHHNNGHYDHDDDDDHHKKKKSNNKNHKDNDKDRDRDRDRRR